jgi:hypothetical protein
MIGSFTRGCGVALCVAGVATFALNLIVSPMLPKGSFATIAASDVYLLRQSCASMIALLLVFGIVGLHVSRLGRVGAFGTIAFVLALTGAVGLFSIEYNQVFTVRDVALHAPALLDRIMVVAFGPLITGAALAIGAFYLGWILLALSLLGSRQYSKASAGLVLAGIAVGLGLSGVEALGRWHGVASSFVISLGWFLIGLQMARSEADQGL